MEEPQVIFISDSKPSLEELQSLVGGYIEVIIPRLKPDEETNYVVNEEGSLKNLPPNKKAEELTGVPIVGNMVVLAKKALLT